MKISTLVILACLVVACVARPKPRPAEPEYDEDYEVAPKPKPTPAKRPLIGRGPIGRPGAKTTTTTTTPAPLENEEVAEEVDYDDEVAADPTTTTPAPKKIGAGIVRPFRSNDDLLATLKKRREQAANGKTQAAKVQDDSEPREESTPAPKRASSSGAGRKNRFSGNKSEDVAGDAESAAAPSRSTGRRFNSRS